MHHVRQPEGQILREFCQNATSLWICLLQRLREVSRFAALCFRDQLAKNTIRAARFELADFGVHRPTRTARFNRRPLTVQADVSDLCFARFGSMINLFIHYQAATDAAAEGNVEYNVESRSRSVHRLTQCPHIGIVIDSDWLSCQLLQPLAQIKVGPAHNLMRAANLARFPVDRSPKTDGDR